MDLRQAVPTQCSASDEDLVAELQAGRTDAALTELEARYGRRILHFVHGMFATAIWRRT